jgi:hypothetical protein
VSGKNQIATYFQNAKAPLMQTFGLIGDIAGALLRISTGKGATPLIAVADARPDLRERRDLHDRGVRPGVDRRAREPAAAVRADRRLQRPADPDGQADRPIAGGLADLLGTTPALSSMTVSFIGLYGAVKALRSCSGRSWQGEAVRGG